MLTLMYITNRPEIARVAQESGVDRVFVDLEIRGKVDRQGHLDTVISGHSIEDVGILRGVLDTSELLVRVNPIYDGSIAEIDQVLERGADVIMLPYFHSRDEVATFVECVGGRAKTCVLFETPEAVADVEAILTVRGIDEAYVGLNDLHLGYGMRFMFELLADGTVERLCDTFHAAGLRYGFGGIARIGHGVLPAEYVIGEHYRLGSSMVILSRSFCEAELLDSIGDSAEVFRDQVAAIREHERAVQLWSVARAEGNRRMIVDAVAKVASSGT